MRFILFQNGCTQPLLQCVPVSFPRVKRPGCEVTHLHLVSRLAMNTTVSWYAFRASKGKTFTAAEFSYAIRQSNLFRLHINIPTFLKFRRLCTLWSLSDLFLYSFLCQRAFPCAFLCVCVCMCMFICLCVCIFLFLYCFHFQLFPDTLFFNTDD